MTTNNTNRTAIRTASTNKEITRIQDFFNSDPIREELHAFTFRDTLERAVRRDDRWVCYTDDGEIITSAEMVWCESRILEEDEAQIRLLATHPDYRRQGLASLLVESVDSFVANQGKSTVKIDVVAHEAAADFWRHIGFEGQKYWKTDSGREMITMERPLK